MPWTDPLLAATAALLSQEVLRFLLQTTLTYSYSASLFVADYEKRLYFLIADFAFHGAHFGHSPLASIFDAP
ncbi:MAG: hypothetical protein M0Q43_13115 [Methanothrix sp.]|jgi:hypothetical protein|nr:hypothetical protein [Methanothrix sp.]